ncbi:MAG: tetratricopeptide repeat protein [Candidatus Calescibacterium sp.]|jgi:tetratricopeptide (TPR) repeat protein|nr:tetratricopeptide repeat protein [Candidatus Calescibacterium sp.]
MRVRKNVVGKFFGLIFNFDFLTFIFVTLFLLSNFSCAKKPPPTIIEEKIEDIKRAEKEEVIKKAEKLTFEEAKASIVADPYVMFGIGLRKEAEGNLDEAEKFYSYAIELKPNMVDAWVNLAEIKSKKGKIDDGLKVLEDAEKIVPADPKIKSAKALFYMRKGDYKKAEEILKKASSEVGMRKEIEKTMGYLFIETGRYNLGLFIFDELSKKYPDDPENFFMKGEIYMRTKNFADAIREFEKGLKIKRDKVIFLKLGICYFKLNAIDDAEKAFKEALSEDSNMWEAYLNLGLIYKRKGEFEKAEEMYKKALSFGKRPQILYNLANLYETMSSYYQMSTQKSLEYLRLAKNYLKEYSEFVQDNAEKDAILKRIDKLEKSEKKAEEKLEKEIKKLGGEQGKEGKQGKEEKNRR